MAKKSLSVKHLVYSANFAKVCQVVVVLIVYASADDTAIKSSVTTFPVKPYFVSKSEQHFDAICCRLAPTSTNFFHQDCRMTKGELCKVWWQYECLLLRDNDGGGGG